MHWIIIGAKPAYYLKLFWSMWCQRFHLQGVCTREWFCILPRMKKSMALFHIKSFSCPVTILLKRKCQHMGGHKWVICGSHPGCSVGQWVDRCDPLSTLMQTLLVYLANLFILLSWIKIKPLKGRYYDRDKATQLHCSLQIHI